MTDTNEPAAVSTTSADDNSSFDTPSMDDDNIARHELERMDIIRRFENGMYPYKDRVKKSDYETDKALLQVELLKVQKWVKESGKKVVILFEGRDDKALYGTPQSAWRTRRGTGKTHRRRTNTMVLPALYQSPALGR
jgi:hypothetical protein